MKSLAVNQGIFQIFIYRKKIFQILIYLTISDFLLFYEVLLLQEVTKCAKLTDQYGIYELPHELHNDLRLSILGN